MRKCYICKELKEDEDFYRDRTKSSGRASRCKECCSNRKRIRPDRKKYMSEYTKKYNSKEENQIKLLAHRLVTKAVRDGIILEEGCEECGKKADAHHDDYNYPLKIRWLCRKHHQKHHAKLKQIC